ncbi:MAG: AAA family ATPase [Saprospiraceae bacterium]
MKLLRLNNDFNDILHELEYTFDNYFITGRAGTGKSTLLQLFRQTTHKRVVVLAPTGIAALNVRGQTIHSFFSFPPRIINKSEIKRSPNFHLFKNIDAIVIDEISMVRADIIDHIHQSLVLNRQNNSLFGGIQMIFFGDLYQLPPVVSGVFEKQYFRTVYHSPYFFSAKIFEQIDLKFIELNKVYRQEEKDFIQLLDKIRTGNMDEDDFWYLNERFCAPENEDDHLLITLSSRNDIASTINKNKLESLPHPVVLFQAKIQGEFSPQLFPTDYSLHLKIGAQVMFVRNDPFRRYVNGTIGIVKRIDEGKVYVVVVHDHTGVENEIEVEPADWDILKYEFNSVTPKEINIKTLGTFTQLPLKLAWAITIHKSQGKTFDKIMIDLGSGAFETGQTYVALSRCRTLNGVYLRNPIKYKDIIVDPRIQSYYNGLKYLN